MSSNPTLINALKTKQWRCRDRWREQRLVSKYVIQKLYEEVCRGRDTSVDTGAGYSEQYQISLLRELSNHWYCRVTHSTQQWRGDCGETRGREEGESTISSDTTNHCSCYFRGPSLTDVEIRNYCSPCSGRAAASSLTKPGMKSQPKHNTQEDWAGEIIWDTREFGNNMTNPNCNVDIESETQRRMWMEWNNLNSQ